MLKENQKSRRPASLTWNNPLTGEVLRATGRPIEKRPSKWNQKEKASNEGRQKHAGKPRESKSAGRSSLSRAKVSHLRPTKLQDTRGTKPDPKRQLHENAYPEEAKDRKGQGLGHISW